MLFFFVSHNSKFILKSDLEDNEFMRNFKDKVVVITGAGSGIGIFENPNYKFPTPQQ